MACFLPRDPRRIGSISTLSDRAAYHVSQPQARNDARGQVQTLHSMQGRSTKATCVSLVLKPFRVGWQNSFPSASSFISLLYPLKSRSCSLIPVIRHSLQLRFPRPPPPFQPKALTARESTYIHAHITRARWVWPKQIALHI